jgi:hypothetical protein
MQEGQLSLSHFSVLNLHQKADQRHQQKRINASTIPSTVQTKGGKRRLL